MSEKLETAGFVNGFSTRLGGISPMPASSLNLAGFNEDAAQNILENRRRFLKLFPGSWSLAGCWQVHGADVRQVHSAQEIPAPEQSRGESIYCDAVISNAANVLAGVKTADCVPILIGDPNTGAFAAVHAGWRGTLEGIASHAVKRMVDAYQTQPANLQVAIGPAAGGCCYEVGTDVIEAFRTRFPHSDSPFTATRDGRARVDLLSANRNQLIHLGVRAERIQTAPLCTMCNTDLFFSYRKEKKTQGKVGRLMSVIGRNQHSASSAM